MGNSRKGASRLAAINGFFMGDSAVDKFPFSDTATPGRGQLYVVATPIGNLNDITFRALDVLKQVDLIAAEDTRHSKVLLNHFGIQKPMLSLHDHNEEARISELLGVLDQGRSVALISDAGTPLISDPGFRLVRAVRCAGASVIPVPGACAAVSALSASGMPSDRFLFVGFAPSKSQARKRFLEGLMSREETLIFYESPKRIYEFLSDAVEVFGAHRQACVAKELTKMFERFFVGPLAEVHADLSSAELQRGEFVVMIGGAESTPGELNAGVGVDIQQALRTAARYLPPKQACALIAEIFSLDKKQLYQQWISQRGEQEE